MKFKNIVLAVLVTSLLIPAVIGMDDDASASTLQISTQSFESVLPMSGVKRVDQDTLVSLSTVLRSNYLPMYQTAGEANGSHVYTLIGPNTADTPFGAELIRPGAPSIVMYGYVEWAKIDPRTKTVAWIVSNRDKLIARMTPGEGQLELYGAYPRVFQLPERTVSPGDLLECLFVYSRGMARASFLGNLSDILRRSSASIQAEGGQFTLRYIQDGSITELSGDLYHIDDLEIPVGEPTNMAYQLTPQQVAELLELEKGHFRYASE